MKNLSNVYVPIYKFSHLLPELAKFAQSTNNSVLQEPSDLQEYWQFPSVYVWPEQSEMRKIARMRNDNPPLMLMPFLRRNPKWD